MFGGDLTYLSNVKGQLIAISIVALLAWLYTRASLLTVAEYTLCKREFRERKKGHNLIEVIFLTNLKDVVPKYMFVLLYSQLVVLLLLVLAVTMAAYMGVSKDVVIDISGSLVLIMVVPILIHWCFFHKHSQKDGIAPRFIPRKHVVTQKHTQPQRNSNRPKKNTKSKKK